MNKIKPAILVIDDEDSMLRTYRSILKNSYQPVMVNSGHAALEKIREESFPVALLDIIMPDMDGVEVLRQIKALDKNIEVIMVSANREVKSAVQAIKLGAYDYIAKPFEVDELLTLIEKAQERRSLIRENIYLRQALEEKGSYIDMLGRSEAISKVFTLIDKVSSTDSTVLITGESGTGKELVAHAIYKKSRRSSKPFVVVNCAAIPENLIESDLFGHERGAFTGALERREGKFELADGGTIFLDEIGCMPAPLQSRLLRVLQDNVIERIGGEKPIQVNVRVIAATNMNIEESIKKGEFRQDLFYRLNVIRIDTPPLRERKEDIPVFLDYFMDKFNREFNKTVKGFSGEAIIALVNYDWPGNIRELENLVERMVVISDNQAITSVNDLPFNCSMAKGEGKPLKETLDDFEKKMIIASLAENKGNQTKTAETLGIHRTTLISKMEQLGIK